MSEHTANQFKQSAALWGRALHWLAARKRSCAFRKRWLLVRGVCSSTSKVQLVPGKERRSRWRVAKRQKKQHCPEIAKAALSGWAGEMSRTTSVFCCYKDVVAQNGAPSEGHKSRTIMAWRSEQSGVQRPLWKHGSLEALPSPQSQQDQVRCCTPPLGEYDREKPRPFPRKSPPWTTFT